MDKTKHILYLAYDGMTDPLGQSQVIPYLEGLNKKGYSITLISAEKKEEKHRTEYIKQILYKAGIDWHPISYTKKPPVLSTIFDVFKMRKQAEDILRQKKVKIVHCRSYITALVGLFLKKKYNVKFIFDMRGFYADERLDGKIWTLKNPIYKYVYNFFKRKEKEFLAQADYTISLTNNGKNEILTWDFPKIKAPIEVIPCCADLSLFSVQNIDEQKKEIFRKKLKLNQSDFVLSYLGSIGTWYMLSEMLDFFKVLKEYRPNAKFLLITGDTPKDILKEAIKKNIEKDDIKIIKSAREDVPTLLSLSQLSTFFILPVFSKKASSPTKQGEIMGMGIPIVCNAGVGDTDYVINTYNCGALLESLDDASYHQICVKLDEILEIDKNAIRAGAASFYALKNGVEKYAAVYKQLTE